MDKKTIVITGSTRGIGYGLAVKLPERGLQLVINGSSEASVGQKVEELQQQGFGSDGRIMKKLTLYGSSKRAINYFQNRFPGR